MTTATLLTTSPSAAPRPDGRRHHCPATVRSLLDARGAGGTDWDRARSRLAQIHAPLLWSLASCESRRTGYRVDRTELVGVAFVAFFGVLDRFDPDRGHQFATLATRRIRFAIRDSVQADRVGFGTLDRQPADSLDEWAESDGDWGSDDAEALAFAVAWHLSEAEAEVVRLRFGLEGREPASLAEIARRQGVSETQVRRTLATALLRLRRVWADKEVGS